jgi:hypothetical protein
MKYPTSDDPQRIPEEASSPGAAQKKPPMTPHMSRTFRSVALGITPRKLPAFGSGVNALKGSAAIGAKNASPRLVQFVAVRGNSGRDGP